MRATAPGGRSPSAGSSAWTTSSPRVDTVSGPQLYLMPGQTVTVTGGLTVDDKPVKSEPYYWLGLIHEQVWIVQDRVQPTQIAVGY